MDQLPRVGHLLVHAHPRQRLEIRLRRRAELGPAGDGERLLHGRWRVEHRGSALPAAARLLAGPHGGVRPGRADRSAARALAAGAAGTCQGMDDNYDSAAMRLR